MAWITEMLSSRGNRGGYIELPGSILTPAEVGWDTAVMNIASRDAVGAYFDKGDPHPDYTGLFVSQEPEQGEYWRGDIRRYTVRFAGLKDFVSGTVLRSDEQGGNRTERTVTAADYYGDSTPVSGYGGNQRRLINIPGGVADAIRLISIQPWAERQFITSVPPPTTYSLAALKVGAVTLTPAAATPLNDLGVEIVYNYPNGMLAGTVRYKKHPSLTVSMWLLDIRWEAVAERDIT